MSRSSQFSLGMKKLLTGFGFLFKHPSLWTWIVIPWALGVFLFTLSFGYFVNAFADVYHFLLAHLGLENMHWLLQQLFKPFIFLLGMVLLSILSYLGYLIFAEPFLDILAEKVSLLAADGAPPLFQWGRFFKSIGPSVLAALQKVGLFLSIPIVFWVLNFIPVFGNFLYVALTTFFEMWVLGFTTVEYPMGQQWLSFRERLKFGRKFKYALCGLGLPFLIPFAPLLLQAPMVVGGTLLFLELNRQPHVGK